MNRRTLQQVPEPRSYVTDEDMKRVANDARLSACAEAR